MQMLRKYLSVGSSAMYSHMSLKHTLKLTLIFFFFSLNFSIISPHLILDCLVLRCWGKEAVFCLALLFVWGFLKHSIFQ